MFTFIQIKSENDTEQKIWNDLNNSVDNSSFLTSQEWISFQKILGKEIFQFQISYKSEILGLIYVEVYRRKLQKFAYAPYSPVVDLEKLSNLQTETEPKKDLNKIQLEFWKSFKIFTKEFIKNQNLTLFRFDPLLPKNHLQNLLEVGFKPSLAPGQAKDTWEINLEATEDILRGEMSKSTRYNINKTSREGLKFIQATTDEHIKAFAKLMQETTGRKGFGNYDYLYFKKQFEDLNPKGLTDIFLAKKGDKYLAGALINYHNKTAYYTHGCSTSDRELAKLRAPYFLQWNIIQKMKSDGYKKYNMWGILPEGIKGAISGVSEFKKSFGGYEINYVGPLEVFYSPLKYTIHRLIDWWVYRKDRY